MTNLLVNHFAILTAYGAKENEIKEAQQHSELHLGRVLSQSHGLYRVMLEDGERRATVSGTFRHEADALSDYPAVGDFVLTAPGTEEAVIRRVLPRRSVFARPVAGSQHEMQIVAANVDVVFICMALNGNYNLNRLERYLAVGWNSGATPVVVLTKADLCEDVPTALTEVERAAAGADVHVTSALTPETTAALWAGMQPGMTAAFIGSSGVGKSTLINLLAGEERMSTSATSQAEDRGRHTTTRRELMLLPGGVLVMDTPGMRELGVDAADVDAAFEDIEALAARCRFRDCSHTREPGCAVRQAVEDGRLSRRRLDSYLAIRQEAGYDGLSARGIDQKKVQRMFGGKEELKRFRRGNR